MSSLDRQGPTLEGEKTEAHRQTPEWNLCSLVGQDKHSFQQKATGTGAEDVPMLSIHNGSSSNSSVADNFNFAGSPFAPRNTDTSSANGAHPFSAADISNAGKQVADKLLAGSSNPNAGWVEMPNPNDAISNLKAVDRSPQALNEDVSDYGKAGAVGGIQTLVLNDCWFESPLAALANAPGGAERISQMITSNPDGGYTVTFPGASDKPITLSKDEVDKDGQITNTAEWGKVLEAAILKVDPNECSVQGPGGFAMNAIQLLTGENASYQFVANSNANDMASLISSALQQGKPVVVDSDQFVPPADGAAPPPDAAPPVQPPLIDGHTYAVIGCDPGNNTITLRNPWGTNDVAPGTQENGITVEGAGEISMSMDAFMKNFRQVSYASGGQPERWISPGS